MWWQGAATSHPLRLLVRRHSCRANRAVGRAWGAVRSGAGPAYRLKCSVQVSVRRASRRTRSVGWTASAPTTNTMTDEAKMMGMEPME